MPANITQVNGRAEMMYTGEVPWHGLGIALDNPATSSEALKAASLDWNVVRKAVYIEDLHRNMVDVTEKKAIVREDTCEVFAVMSSNYTPLQNRDAFTFFDSIVGQKLAMYHTAGSLDGGRKVWLLAKLPGNIKVSNKDVVEKYVLLSNSHDGTRAVTMMLTPIRVVCQNTLNIALSQGSNRFYSRHTPNMMNRVNAARDILGLTEVYYQLLQDQISALVERAWTEKQMKDMTLEVFLLKDTEEYRVNQQFVLDKTMELFLSGHGIDADNRGTAWAAFNAVTEYLDHWAPVGRGGSVQTAGVKTLEVANKRMSSAWFGRGAEVKQKTWDYLVTAKN